MEPHHLAISACSLPRYSLNEITASLFSGVSVGDLNADGMDDLYCYTNDGNVAVAISTVTGKIIKLIRISFSRNINFFHIIRKLQETVLFQI